MKRRWTRRQILSGAALAATGCVVAGTHRSGSAWASAVFGPGPGQRGADTLVCLFLRGGADGLNMVVPFGEDDYYRLRPTLAIAPPGDRTQPVGARALDLDGFFGLHPALGALLPYYRDGWMAVVHAVGSGDHTRSHFEAMATMERGLHAGTGVASGWLGRHLAATAREVESPLRAVAISDTLPDSLRGATTVTALQHLSEFRLVAPRTELPEEAHARDHQDRTDALTQTLRALYRGAGGAPEDPVVRGGRESLAAMEAVRQIDPANYRPAPGAQYPDDVLGRAFQQVACLIKADAGLEVACLDMGGWDTHFGQGRDTGLQPRLLQILGDTLAAFLTDLGPRAQHTTLLVMTEFGRRAYENYSLGTDHGRASVMLLLGAHVVGGRVHAEWPTLAKDRLEDGGDLRVTTDYRDVLAEVVRYRLKNPALQEVFPGYVPRMRGVVRPG
ncbi:MAG: DUF1501 domain-containing protein [Chloroherpetonaceae bacterium]|nr:DUF1501 domain-containing protein [Chthonomonadaceae bacterium]MDW8207018.1 DUF1501 domain-containing protein [Chloroherpetonaceae bacterium]